MAERRIRWPGESGQKYLYWINDFSTNFDGIPANYIFARETQPSKFRPIYIGHTDNLKERLSNHEKMSCIRENKATHVCIHPSSSNKAIRQEEERDLVNRWKPGCNV